MDLDFALRIDKATLIMDVTSNKDKRISEKWDRSNRLSLMIIKCGIPKAFRGTVFGEITDVVTFFVEIEKYFTKSNKVETSILLKKLISMIISFTILKDYCIF